jgi:HK97 family phage major capsid protein
MAEHENALDAVMSAFGEFKAANDANLKARDVVLEDKIGKISASLDRFEDMNTKLVNAQNAAKAMQEQVDRVEAVLNRKDFGKGGVLGDVSKDEIEYREAFNRAIRKAPDDRRPEDVAALNQRKAALIKADDTAAGYLVAPSEMMTGIIKDIVEISAIRSMATVVAIGSQSLKMVKRTATAGAATRVGEQGTRSNTGDPAYGMLEIPAPEMYARAEISQQMLEDSGYDLEAELRGEFAEQFALKEGTEFVSGTGVNNQAEGLLTNADVGEVVSGAATAITADGLINLFYAPKTFYVSSSQFIMNRSTIREVRKLKDGEGNYLWTPGIPGAVPNTILGAGYMEVPDMPSIGAGTYPVIFGDIRRAYVIVDRIALQVQVDYTTGADSGLVVFRARRRVGGGVRQAEPIKKLKIAAS